MSEALVPKCAVCSAPAGQLCGGCRLEHYCGRVHQKQAWRDGHRLRCSAFRLDTDDVRGRHLVATRDIRCGELILKEKPASLGPKISCFPTCLGCYTRVEAQKQPDGSVDYPKCPRCNWPVCGEQCADAPVHRRECDLMVKRKYRSTITFSGEDKKESAYCVIAPLRCLLLKDADPKQYEAITSLEDHLEERSKTPLYRVLKANLVTFIQQVLGLTQFTEDDIMKIAGIFDTNAYDIRFGVSKQSTLRGIYLSASMRSHDCNPNTKHVFDAAQGYTMSVIATVDIPKGAIITTSYTQPLWGTLARRVHLIAAKCFWCTCDRCADPTELGTHLGAIYCTKCYDTLKDPKDIPKVRSVDPLDNGADWRCPECGHTIAAKQMIWGNEAIKKDVQALNRRSAKDFEEFVVKYERVLHPTNYHLIGVKYALCEMYGHIEGFKYDDLNDYAINRKMTLCEEILDVLNVLNPGLSRARGTILLELQETMVVKTKRDLASEKITNEAARDLMEECMALLQEATTILKSEPDMKEVLEQRLQSLAFALNED